MKTQLIISMKVADIDLKMLTIEADSPERARRILCSMISGSFSVPEVGDAYIQQVAQPVTPTRKETIELSSSDL